ncbi:major facilitator superfamily domain-containing protein [Thamnidium elegans]|nr:major facilitator superfamily domain-containing protein [Thamnidium elegans]
MSNQESSSYSDENVPLLNNTKRPETLKDLNGHWKPLLASFFLVIVSGLNDGCLGTIIPRMKLYYDISNETISILFLCTACGFFISAAFNGYVVHNIGQLKTLYLGATTVLIAYTIISQGFPFIVVACTMPFVGAGIALLNAAVNVFVANVPLATIMLNVLHALYGVGAFISPRVSAYLLVHNYSWMGMYKFLIGVAILNLVAITVGFLHVDFEAKHEDEDEDSVKPDHSELTKLAIFNRVTLLGAAYILIYAGVEVTIGGWGLTWLTEGRHGEAEPMLQVVSGYWGGLAFGRILLGYLCNKFGDKLMITVYTAMIIAGLSIMRLSTDLVLDSIAFITVGALLGPMFPTTISLASKVLPRNFHATSIGFMSAFGAGGAALFPFITGQVAGRFGILIMPTACIVMAVTMMILWAFIPSDKPMFGACR